MPKGWSRPHWRNRTDAQELRENDNPYHNPWYVLMRFESINDDSISVGYTDEEMSAYVLALNGQIVELFETKKAVREAATQLQRDVPLISSDDEELDFNDMRSFVAAHNIDVENPDKGQLQRIIEQIEKAKDDYYQIEDVSVQDEE